MEALILAILSFAGKLLQIVVDAWASKNKTSAEIDAALQKAWQEFSDKRAALKKDLQTEDTDINSQIDAIKATEKPKDPA